MSLPQTFYGAAGITLVVVVACGLGLYGSYRLVDVLYKIWAGGGMNGM